MVVGVKLDRGFESLPPRQCNSIEDCHLSDKICPRSSADRAPGCGLGGRRFKSCRGRHKPSVQASHRGFVLFKKTWIATTHTYHNFQPTDPMNKIFSQALILVHHHQHSRARKSSANTPLFGARQLDHRNAR